MLMNRVRTTKITGLWPLAVVLTKLIDHVSNPLESDKGSGKVPIQAVNIPTTQVLIDAIIATDTLLNIFAFVP
jgi:hypothetical protein